MSWKIQKMDFSFKQLEVFCKIVETGSFSKAAEEVFLTQSSVSERIANLERQIGAKLFDRIGKKVFLTDVGKLFYRYAKRLLEEKERISEEIQDFLGVKKGKLSIGGSTIPGEYILPKVIKKFNERYPLINVNISVHDSKKVQNMVLNGTFQLGIIGFIQPDQNIRCKSLWKDELVVAVPKGHRWMERKEIELKELFEEPFIMREEGSGTLRTMEEYLKRYEPDFKKKFKVITHLGSSTAVKEGIKAGLGISIISIRAIETEVKAGIIFPLRIKGVKMFRNFYLIWDKRRTRSPIAEEFIKFLEEWKDEQL